MSRRRAAWRSPLGCSCMTREATGHRLNLESPTRGLLLDPSGAPIADLDKSTQLIVTVWRYRLRRRGGLWVEGSARSPQEAAEEAIEAWEMTSPPALPGDEPDALAAEVSAILGTVETREPVKVRANGGR